MNEALNQLKAVCLGEFCYFEEIDSTNAFLLRNQADLPKGSLCWAQTQSAGRGRRGRQWVSPQTENLYFSLLWRYDNKTMGNLSGLSLAVAICIVQTLSAHGVSDLQIKWPNDIYFQGKKAGGILIENSFGQQGLSLIIGIGLNLKMDVDVAQIDQAWADLAEFRLDRTAFLTDLVRILQEMLQHYPLSGFAPWLNEWQKWDYLQGQAVRLSMENAEIQGIAQGVNDQGELLLDINGELRAFLMGELSVRLASSI